MTHVRRSLAACAGALALALAVPATAEAADPDMVGLGDSYASGVGTRSYYSDSGSCQRSPQAYPVIDAARVGATLTFVACSGATTATVLSGQIGALSSETDLVTLSAGGNDIGFVPVITTCAQPWWSSNCNGAIDGAQAKIRDQLPGALDSLYSAVREHAPNARVVVTGYPHLFMGEDCNAATWFSPAEEQRLNETADQLNATLRSHAEAHGFSFVDPTTAFTGHAVCDRPEWINGLSNPVSESYHPNQLGQSGYADLVDDYLT